ncbi:hypothetical protein FDH82_gp38 [Roseobacter phage RDJL Phi 2]|uniref:DUF7352 domain-containing protein n=1 Tax=Roseobacter phage RDJL Phi 2 TaxID=1682380 RepID=A0A0K0PWP5_9CAUD|nr:hypothetical protein FDH82_gp38 [Roseobacter phage RDJL Phi 2]AKQ75828.1 hypothetical protein RDJLphi2_gp38 [Roseobacter phage RDJL Phi 2]
MQIWKFPLRAERHQMVVMPAGSVPLSIQMQNGAPTLWASVHPDAPKMQRDLSLIGTGHDLPSGVQSFIGTVQDGALVWHLFDGGEH